MATILEEFFIEFASNSDEVASSLERVEKSLEKIEEKGRDATAETDKTTKGFTLLTSQTKKLIATLGAAALGMKALQEINTTAAFARSLDLWGQSATEVSAWTNAVVLSGGSVNDFVGTLATMSQGLAEIGTTGQSALLPLLNLLQINPVDANGSLRESLDVIEEISDRISGLDPAQATFLARQAGIDDATIRLMMQGGDELRELIYQSRKYGVVTKEQAERSKEFTKSWFSLGIALGAVKRAILDLPGFDALTKGIEKAADFIADNATTITRVLAGIGVALAALGIYFLPFSGFIVVIAALAAVFAFAYSEVRAFSEGAPSLLGYLVDSIKGVASDITKQVKQIGAVIESIGSLTVLGFTTMVDQSLLLLDRLVNIAKGKLETVKEFFKGLYNIVTAPFSAQKDRIEKYKKDLDSYGAKDKLSQTSTPLSALPTSAITNSANNRTSNVSIHGLTINTQATDAQGIAADLNTELKAQFNQAIYNSSNGVVA